MKADTVDVLTTKGRFQTEQALAVAEAIDMAIRDAQLVTVPILDARFLEAGSRVDNRFAEADAKVEKRFAEVNQRFAEADVKLEKRFAEVNQRFAEVDAKVENGFTKITAQIETSEAKAEARDARLRLHLFVVVVVCLAVTSPLGVAALEALKRAF
jgi:tetrahydromethanopterin S-methyltransferase subunit G